MGLFFGTEEVLNNKIFEQSLLLRILELSRLVRGPEEGHAEVVLCSLLASRPPGRDWTSGDNLYRPHF